MDIVAAHSDKELLEIERLASAIWHEHYTPIIGKEQVVYMLEKFQSFKAMKEQIFDGYEYYSMTENNELIGYLGIQPRENSLFLSKIYFTKSMRGKGLARIALGFLAERAKQLKCTAIELTVNKYNSGTIAAYEKMGFEKVRPAVFDIGGGYIMDDYIMKKSLVQHAIS